MAGRQGTIDDSLFFEEKYWPAAVYTGIPTRQLEVRDI
jgi:hypothetical protein